MRLHTPPGKKNRKSGPIPTSQPPSFSIHSGTDSGYMPVISTISVGAQMRPNLGVTPTGVMC